MTREALITARWFPAGFFALFLVTSCIEERFDAPAPISADGGERTVSVRLSLPGQVSGVNTYALSGDDEEYVKSIEVLLFGSDNKYIETRTVRESEISGNGSGNIKNFTLKIPEGDYPSMVFLANSYNIVFNAGLNAAYDKDSALEKLKLANNGKWITGKLDPSYRDIPMWGELSNVSISADTSPATLLKVSLKRMLAKVSVLLDDAIENFELQTIHVYNYYDKGAVAPVGDGLTLPVDAAKPDYSGDKPYTKLTYTKIDGEIINNASVNEIYLFESDNSSQDDLKNRTCLVIGGAYGGETNFYRVDFVKEENGSLTYLDILRNHHYTFKVNSISGPGYTDPDDAFNARPFNIDADVVVWDDLDIKDVETDGRYMLGVSGRKFNLSMDEYTHDDTDNKLTIITDHPRGWEITDIIDNATGTEAGWLSIDDDKMTGEEETLSLILSLNDTGNERAATITVVAGNLSMQVEVHQGIVPKLGLLITDENGIEINELIFDALYGSVPARRVFKVFWAPKTKSCTITNNQVGTVPFNYGSTGADNFETISETDGAGEQTFTIAPPAFTEGDDPFTEKISRVDFTISNGISYIGKSIFLRQINYAIIFSGHERRFLMDGGEHSFLVKSNDAWTATSTDNEGVLSEPITSSGNGDISNGEELSFKLKNYMTGPDAGKLKTGSFTITFTNDSGNTLATITIRCISGTVWAGSNIYWDETNQILTFDDYTPGGNAPNEQYQGVLFRWGSLWGVMPYGPLSSSRAVVYKPDYDNNGYTESSEAWGNIPYVAKPARNTNRYRKYLTDEVHNPADGKGDICKYLTDLHPGGKIHDKKWRMPTAGEFDAIGSYQNIWTTTNLNLNQSGTGGIDRGYQMTSAIGMPFFPASGNRSQVNGSLFDEGAKGFYWSSTPSGDYSDNFLYFDNSRFSTKGSPGYDVRQAFSVRCVVDANDD